MNTSQQVGQPNKGESVSDAISTSQAPPTPGRSEWSLPCGIGVTAWLLVFAMAVLITWALPDSYCSTARVWVGDGGSSLGTPRADQLPRDNLPGVATACEVMRSELVLGKVVEELNLNATWGRRFLSGEPLKTQESLAILRKLMDVRPVGNTSLIAIRVWSQKSEESAQIANAVAKTYTTWKVGPGQPASGPVAQIVDAAVPGLRPAKPNRPLNIFLALLFASLAGVGAGALTFWLRRSFRRLKADLGSKGSPDAQQYANRRTAAAVTVGTIVGVFSGAVLGGIFGVPLGLVFDPIFGTIIGVAVGVTVAGAHPRSIAPPEPGQPSEVSRKPFNPSR